MAWTAEIAKDGNGDLARLTVVWDKDLPTEFTHSAHLHLKDADVLSRFRVEARRLRDARSARRSDESTEVPRLKAFMNQPE